MKKIFSFFLPVILVIFVFSANSYSQKPSKFRLSGTIPAGTYLFNHKALYFFDDGIDCYLLKQCNDIDSVFEASAEKVVFTKDTTIKYLAYLFTDNYEYMYVSINKKEGWLRANVPMDLKQKNFLKKFSFSPNYPRYATYVEIIPFKTTYKVFISDAEDWYIGDLNAFKIQKIGTKGGRLEACQMIFKKNCVMCYIDLSWGEYLWFDEDGRKCK